MFFLQLLVRVDRFGKRKRGVYSRHNQPLLIFADYLGALNVVQEVVPPFLTFIKASEELCDCLVTDPFDLIDARVEAPEGGRINLLIPHIDCLQS